MPSDEGDSGIDALSMPESRENSPTVRDQKSESIEVVEKRAERSIEDDDEDLEETLAERLIGLTEMFPERFRNGVCSMAHGSIHSAKWIYAFSRSTCWVFFSSAALLVMPIVFEMERIQMDEMQKAQQRQILLGPSAAISGGMVPVSPGVPPAPPR